jgi:sulfotransferase
MKNLHFFSGLPRSGSTVLAAILNQNLNTHVSTTSGLVHALDGLANIWAQAPLLNENDPQRDGLAKTMLGTIETFYADVAAPVIIDKSRGTADHVWRVFDNEKEYVVKNVRIEVPS